ncbi:MAG: hypothetical protein AAFQ99_06625, partial [Pseudomonadota bacterium]
MYRNTWVLAVVTGVTLLLCRPLLAATTFEFRQPTGLSNPVFETTSITVPNDYIFNEIDALHADLIDGVVAAAAAEPDLTLLQTPIIEFQNPFVRLSGEDTSVILTVGGIDRIRLSARVRTSDFDWYIRLLCGSNVSATITVNDASIDVDYNYFGGAIDEVRFNRSSVQVANVECSAPIIGDIVVFLAPVFGFDFVDEVSDAIDDLAAEQPGRYQNLFSLEDALQGLQVSGNREIQRAVEDALDFLSGARFAAAAFIANEITDDLIVRLNLQTQSQIDQLND